MTVVKITKEQDKKHIVSQLLLMTEWEYVEWNAKLDNRKEHIISKEKGFVVAVYRTNEKPKRSLFGRIRPSYVEYYLYIENAPPETLERVFITADYEMIVEEDDAVFKNVSGLFISNKKAYQRREKLEEQQRKSDRLVRNQEEIERLKNML